MKWVKPIYIYIYIYIQGHLTSINSISKTEVQFLFSVGTPTPIGT